MDKWIRFKNRKGNIILEYFESFVCRDKMAELNGYEISLEDIKRFEAEIIIFLRSDSTYLNLVPDKNTKGD